MIPLFTKQKVIEEWLCGFSRRAIANNNDISEGSVSSIVKQYEGEYGSIHYAREIANFLHKKGYDYLQFGRAIRFQNTLDSLGISYDMAGETLIRLQEHCFRNNVDLDSFLRHYTSVVDRLDDISIPIEKFNQIIETNSQTIKTQNNLIHKNNRTLESQHMALRDIERLKPLLPIHAKYLESVESERKKDDIIRTLMNQNQDPKEQVDSSKREKENEEKS